MKLEDISIILACDTSGGIVKNGKIPWIVRGKTLYPEDFNFFKEVTKNSRCVMGRRTYEDIVDVTKQRSKKNIKQILPGREVYVLSRNEEYKPEFGTRIGNIRDLFFEQSDKPIFILGGQKLAIEALAYVNTIHLTIIENKFNCDKKIPIDFIQKHFTIVDGEHIISKHNKDNLYFVTYKRRK